MVSASIAVRRREPRILGKDTDSMRSNTQLKGSGTVATLPTEAAGGNCWSRDWHRRRRLQGFRGPTAHTYGTSTGAPDIQTKVRP